MCDTLNISVAEGIWFCSTVTVGDHFPRIVFSLVKQKVSNKMVITHLGYDGDNSTRPRA